MDNTRQDFAKRSKELIAYVRFTIDVCEGKVNCPTSTKYEQTQLEKTLKASCYLLAYNLVESTARNLVQGVFDHISDNGIRFDDVIDKIKEFVISSLKKRSTEKFLEGMSQIALDIFTNALNAEDWFSGNVDARKLRDTAKKLGVNESIKQSGDRLLTVKTSRNDLAHGHKSFMEVGGDISVPDLIENTASIIAYLRGVIRNFQSYISGQNYLRT